MNKVIQQIVDDTIESVVSEIDPEVQQQYRNSLILLADMVYDQGKWDLRSELLKDLLTKGN